MEGLVEVVVNHYLGDLEKPGNVPPGNNTISVPGSKKFPGTPGKDIPVKSEEKNAVEIVDVSKDEETPTQLEARGVLTQVKNTQIKLIGILVTEFKVIANALFYFYFFAIAAS